ncbi:MAG: hypothetical protein ABW003_06440, partial [Microvirga sp.]
GTGIRAHGASVEAGSQLTLTGSNVSASGTRANALKVFPGGTATVSGSQLLATNNSAVLVDRPGATATLTNTAISAATPVTAIGYGLRVTLGASAVMTGGSSTTQGRDSPAISSGASTVTATNVVSKATGNDNAMGVLSDGASTITLSGGSVTTTGDSVREGARPHGVAARNPGGALIATGTPILTRGAEAFGAVADDGGSMTLNNLSVRTENISNSGPVGAGAIGLFSVAEQVGAQFPAFLTANSVTVETFGAFAHGALAQARNDQPVEKATINLNDAGVITHGAGAVGLRAVLGNYGSPVTGRGEAVITANRSIVQTEGVAAHGALSRDNPTSVTMNQTSVLVTGAFAHGSVAEAGGLIVGNDATVRALGTNAAALFVVGAPGAVSNAQFTGSALANVSGPTIGVAGLGNVSLTNTNAGEAAGGSSSGRQPISRRSPSFLPSVAFRFCLIPIRTSLWSRSRL